MEAIRLEELRHILAAQGATAVVDGVQALARARDVKQQAVQGGRPRLAGAAHDQDS